MADNNSNSCLNGIRTAYLDRRFIVKGLTFGHRTTYTSLLFTLCTLALAVVLALFFPLSTYQNVNSIYNDKSKSQKGGLSITPDLPQDICYYLFLVCFMGRYYPQIILNFTRGRTIGLSVDFQLWALMATGCSLLVFILNASVIETSIMASHTGVRDLIFCLNNFIMTCIIILQIWLLDGFELQKPSPLPIGVFFMILLASVVYLVVFLFFGLNDRSDKKNIVAQWLSVVEKAGAVFSVARFIPQIRSNRKYNLYLGLDLGGVILDIFGSAGMVLYVIFSYCGVTFKSINMCNEILVAMDNVESLALGVISFFLSVTLFSQFMRYYRMPPLDAESAEIAAVLAMSAASAALVEREQRELEGILALSSSETDIELQEAALAEEQFSQLTNAAPAPTTWHCFRCTMENRMLHDECEVCGLEKKESVNSSQFNLPLTGNNTKPSRPVNRF